MHGLTDGTLEMGTAPLPLAGSYKLSLFNGSALPVTLSRLVSIPANGGAGFSCDNRLVGATLSRQRVYVP